MDKVNTLINFFIVCQEPQKNCCAANITINFNVKHIKVYMYVYVLKLISY